MKTHTETSVKLSNFGYFAPVTYKFSLPDTDHAGLKINDPQVHVQINHLDPIPVQHLIDILTKGKEMFKAL